MQKGRGIRRLGPAVLAALLCLSVGCRTLKSQLTAAAGSSESDAGTTAPAGSTKKFHLSGGKGPPGILQAGGTVRHEPSDELGSSHSKLPTPRFEWTNHTGPIGGPFSDGAGGRHHR